ncbi:hypothetical protein SDC9_45874 [bioreactor metagenome]|uniref:Uncharacterized protein n=1 Tax=bioreactor metagenome TaxID=1076179 RepID=A0A644W7A3_9ZZZZ
MVKMAAFRILSFIKFKQPVSVHSTLVPLLLVFVGISLFSSCQIEKRQYMNGFFIGNFATGHSFRNESPKSCDTFFDNVDTVQIAGDAKIQQEKTLIPVRSSDSLQIENSTNGKVFSKSILSIESGILPAFKNSLLSKTSLLTAVPAHWGKGKLHPLAILALSLLGLSIVSYLLFAFLWVPDFVLLLSLLFYILSIVAFIFARKKTLQNKDEWSGIVFIKTILTIELVLLSILLIAFVAAWFLVLTI